MAYSYNDLDRWAKQFFPAFKFSKSPDGKGEMFYPVDVEGWLLHKAKDDQTQRAHKRGTAIYRWNAPSEDALAEDWASQAAVIGAGNITLNNHPQTGIGHDRFTKRPPADAQDETKGLTDGDWYLDFGGWNRGDVRTCGQALYSWTVYGPVLSMPESPQPFEPDGCDENVADAMPPAREPTGGLHSYVEFARIDTILKDLLDTSLGPELDDVQQNRTDLGEEEVAADVKQLIALTYHLFYPGYVPPHKKLMEGQWEAVSVFLRDTTGRGELRFEHASYTQGYNNISGKRGKWPILFPAACRKVDEIERVGDHPVVRVAWGSHANYFSKRNDEQKVNPELNSAMVDHGIWYGAAAACVAFGLVVIVGGVICLFASSPYDVACYVVIAVGVVCCLIGVVFFLINSAILAWERYNDPHATDLFKPTSSVPHDEDPGQDAHAGDGAEVDVDGVGTPGSPATASDERVPFTVHPLSVDPDLDDPKTTPPSWWDFAGRWGVCVHELEAKKEGASWSNSAWRRRPDGFTPTHRNVEALLDLIHQRSDDRTDSTYPNG